MNARKAFTNKLLIEDMVKGGNYMADVYKVTVESASVRKEKNSTSDVIKTLSKGKEVKIYVKEAGEDNKQYGNIKKTGSQWVLMEELKKLGSDNVGTPKELLGEDYVDDTLTGVSESDYDQMLLKNIRAFGSPPRFSKEVDPWYNMSSTVGTGRSMASTWYSSPSLVSFCPGTVDYLPGFNTKKNKNKFFKLVKSAANADVRSMLKKDHALDANGQLYTFRSAYAKYINVVNLLARTYADFAHIGDVTNIMPKQGIPLNGYDYGYYTNPGEMGNSSGIFAETKAAITSTVNDSQYIHFFANNNGIQINESITSSSKNSWLEDKLSEVGLDAAQENIQFLFGGAIGGQADEDFMNILQEARSSSELIGNLGTLAHNYLKGGRLVFPKMITGMRYDKSVSGELTFASLYGDRRSIFKYTILPCLHLLAMGTPLQLSGNMYTYPYLIRLYSPGKANFDLAFMSSLDFVRGGSDNSCWTVDGFPTEITARFTVTPLYSNMMVTSAKNPFLFMQNTALIEYLGVMAGLDLHMNNLTTKVAVAKNLLTNRIHDIPTNIARGIQDTKLANEVRKFLSLL